MFVCCTVFVAFLSVSFFFNVSATTEIYTLSLHDALPILLQYLVERRRVVTQLCKLGYDATRSEERFSRNAETDLVCRLLLEKKKIKPNIKQDDDQLEVLLDATQQTHRIVIRAKHTRQLRV